MCRGGPLVKQAFRKTLFFPLINGNKNCLCQIVHVMCVWQNVFFSGVYFEISVADVWQMYLFSIAEVVQRRHPAATESQLGSFMSDYFKQAPKRKGGLGFQNTQNPNWPSQTKSAVGNNCLSSIRPFLFFCYVKGLVALMAATLYFSFGFIHSTTTTLPHIHSPTRLIPLINTSHSMLKL